MDNSLSGRQNTKENLLRLSAQRRTYRKAKRLSTIRMLLCLPLTPIINAAHFAALVPSGAEGATSDSSSRLMFVSAVTAAILIVSHLIAGAEKRLRLKAATIQESFDCDVLGLQWNDAVAGPPPTYEDVYELAGDFVRESDEYEALRNWYPTIVDAPMDPKVRTICQRMNAVWDSRQRAPFMKAVRVFTIGAMAVSVTWGALLDVSLRAYLVGGAIPMLPLILFFLRFQNQTTEALRTARSIQRRIEASADGLTKHDDADCKTDAQARMIQDDIFRHRAHAPFVPDWYYRFRKSKLEDIVTAGSINAARGFGDSID